ncbi:mate efflux family protein 9 [Phtheirospermum japonicum]|uniref:Mate efflux family protein 9 n=1 Tax=Phtheirospermum japonicum TaxID=374723 RepID=A0A830D382_9LAMI|nr:mate efflux family protein 9 [Phtheirospermum japonicum]
MQPEFISLGSWSFELVILLSGLLPNPQLETSVLSIWYVFLLSITNSSRQRLKCDGHTGLLSCDGAPNPINLSNSTQFDGSNLGLNSLNTIVTLYSIPYGLGAAASTRISNELGAGKSEGARVSVIALMILAAIDAIVASAGLFASRHVFGYIFSNEKEVVDYVTKMAPLVCLSVIMDTMQGVLSGVARGCGWQHIGAYINLAAFYLFGIPIAAALGFWFDFGGKGLWGGILCGATLQTIMLSIITSCTNWEKQVPSSSSYFLLFPCSPVSII